MEVTERSILRSAVTDGIDLFPRSRESEEKFQAERCLDRAFRILSLPEQQLQLVAAGEIFVCSEEILANQYYSDMEFPDGSYLLYSEDREWDVTDEMPPYNDLASCAPRPMEWLVEGMYLANYSQQALTALSSRNLAELLRKYSSDEIALDKARKIKLPGSVYDVLTDIPDFGGRCGICSCDEPTCWSDFCWKENGRIILHYGWTGGWITEVTLYPEFFRGPERKYGEPFR